MKAVMWMGVQCVVWVCFQGGLKVVVCNVLFGCVSRAG